MTETKEKQEKLEREYVIPLRKHWRKAPVYKRSKRAINALKRFVQQHMKAEPKIGKELNELILSRGYRHPPAKVHVTIVKEGDIAKVNLFWIKEQTEKVKEAKTDGVKEIRAEEKPQEQKEIKESIKEKIKPVVKKEKLKKPKKETNIKN